MRVACSAQWDKAGVAVGWKQGIRGGEGGGDPGGSCGLPLRVLVGHRGSCEELRRKAPGAGLVRRRERWRILGSLRRQCMGVCRMLARGFAGRSLGHLDFQVDSGGIYLWLWSPENN